VLHRLLILAISLALAGPVAAEEGDRMVVYLVRHAEKAAEPRRDPGLTPAGEARARALAERMADAGLDGVVTSQFRRARATAAPTAAALGLEPVVVPYRWRKSESHGAEVAAAVRGRFAGGAVLVVGHSDTVPAIVAALGGPELERLCEPTEYAALFTLVVVDGAETTLERSAYGRPDPPRPPECRAPGLQP
jgi:broad specificity phosphatase PhoE